MNRREFLGAGAVLLAVLGLGTAGCSTPVAGSGGLSTSPQPLPANGELRAQAVRMAAADKAAVRGRFSTFAADLFRAAAPGAGNAVLSPYSVLAALGMTALGARGATAQALQKALGADAETLAALLTAADAAFAQAVTTAAAADANGESPMLIDPANALYAQQGLDVHQEFLAALARGYGAGLRVCDFAADPDGARRSVNTWVSERTHALIPELLPAGSIDSLTRFVLVNAVYLKAAWQFPFTESGDTLTFTTATGATVTPAAMNMEGNLTYTDGTGWKSVTLPYTGGKLGLTVILPDKGKLSAVAGSLSGDLVTSAIGGQDTTLVAVRMPAFKTTTAVDLQESLSRMGAGTLFESSADLSGIAGKPGDLTVGKVIHQARISVDKFGTEAAAATAVIGTAGAAPNENPPEPLDFTIDRAFLYVIHDTATLTPLFIGRVSDPTA